MTLRNKVIRPAPKPSWAASRAPARPAKASPTRSRAAVQPRGEPRVRRGQPEERLGERPARTVRRPADESPDHQPDHKALLSERKILQRALVTVVDPVREAAAVRTRHPGHAASRHHLDRAERDRNRLDLHLADPVEHQRIPEPGISLHDQHHHCSQPARAANGTHLRERHFRPSDAKAYAVSHKPVTRNRTPRSRSATVPQDLCQNLLQINEATEAAAKNCTRRAPPSRSLGAGLPADGRRRARRGLHAACPPQQWCGHDVIRIAYGAVSWRPCRRGGWQERPGRCRRRTP